MLITNISTKEAPQTAKIMKGLFLQNTSENTRWRRKQYKIKKWFIYMHRPLQYIYASQYV